MARKDRERARQRHAIERARREQGWEPADNDDEEEQEEARPRRARAARPARPMPDGPRRAPFTKGKKGDVDPRGRVRNRDMILDPKISLAVAVGALVLVVIGIVVHSLPWLPYIGFALAMLCYADLAYSRRLAYIWTAGAALALSFALSIGIHGK